MAELQTFKADHGGAFPKETMGHPGRKLAMRIRSFCRKTDTPKEPVAELKAMMLNTSQACEASADALTREEDKSPKRRRQLQASGQSAENSTDVKSLQIQP